MITHKYGAPDDLGRTSRLGELLGVGGSGGAGPGGLVSGEPPGGGLSGLWGGHGAVLARSAREWKADWAHERRAPLKPSSNRRAGWVALGVVAVFCASLFAIYRLDAFLDKVNWHWAENAQVDNSSEHLSPSIHWRGR
ncbi:MAG: hypothetical protein WCK65_11575 [Rhodospirillaceae bacterium]